MQPELLKVSPRRLRELGYNFIWFNPRKEAVHCHFTMWAAKDIRGEIVSRFQKAGLPASPGGADEISIRLIVAEFDQHRQLLAKVFGEIAQLAAS